MDLNWPDNKKFAFTILDDTDNATVSNIKPVYDFLHELGIHSTKSLWIYPSRDNFFDSQTVEDEVYLEFLYDLQKKGFELCLHGVGSGNFTREEIKNGFDKFNELFGHYPKVQANHSRNPDNIYFSPLKRFTFPLNIFLYGLHKINGSLHGFSGEKEFSPHFWGDINKKHIRFNRGRTFNSINTLAADPHMPYSVKRLNKYSNLWFSSSDGHTLEEFNTLTTPKKVDQLKEEGGLCIVYTHLAEGFAKNGKLDPTFKRNMEYLASQDGYFVPVSEMLSLLPHKDLSYFNELRLDMRWIKDRIAKRLKFHR